MFYNTYGLENDDAGRAKALGADFKDTFFSAGRADANIAPMEVDESPEQDQPAPGERLMVGGGMHMVWGLCCTA